MKVYVYVEGPSDRIALEALWYDWRQKLRGNSSAIHVIDLDNKSKYFRKIGSRASEKLMANQNDLVVGLLDFYPNNSYRGTDYAHDNFTELISLQNRLVNQCLSAKGANPNEVARLMSRFHASALKHDLEMLLLAACDQLREHLGTDEQLDNWRHPVEDQNQNNPPKRVVEELYRNKKHCKYRDTKDAAAVLIKVSNMGAMLNSQSGQLQCPVFKEMLDWIGAKTGVPAY